jgi:RimJ/RimL family protein N-acetyltransferase
VIHPKPVTLERDGIRLEPLEPEHETALVAAATDGRLWELWFTTVPVPEAMAGYISTALAGQRDGHMLPWVVRDVESGALIGSTRYHDIVPAIDRVEIGYTWYSQSRQRTAVNTTCKLLLLGHAFDTLGCKVVGLRTVRDSVLYSILAGEWPDVRKHLELRLNRHRQDQLPTSNSQLPRRVDRTME